MDERKELKQELEQELQWTQYRMNMLDIMEEKLLHMKILAEEVKNNNLIEEEREALSARLNDLAIQVIALDGKSRRTEDGKILE
jgi:hypothetical protein